MGNLEQVREVHAALASRGIPLSTNQIEYSILRQLPDVNGLKAGCEALGVKILAYSPLAMGRLTGGRYGATPAQVSIAWVIAKGAIPIPGAKNADQAAMNAGALTLQLTSQEVQELSALGRKGSLSNWQHG